MNGSAFAVLHTSLFICARYNESVFTLQLATAVRATGLMLNAESFIHICQICQSIFLNLNVFSHLLKLGFFFVVWDMSYEILYCKIWNHDKTSPQRAVRRSERFQFGLKIQTPEI